MKTLVAGKSRRIRCELLNIPPPIASTLFRSRSIAQLRAEVAELRQLTPA